MRFLGLFQTAFPIFRALPYNAQFRRKLYAEEAHNLSFPTSRGALVRDKFKRRQALSFVQQSPKSDEIRTVFSLARPRENQISKIKYIKI